MRALLPGSVFRCYCCDKKETLVMVNGTIAKIPKEPMAVRTVLPPGGTPSRGEWETMIRLRK